ncbi:hypothetical protein EXS54_00190 [Patescibacteria group bacterium]|nr:hypothetical protein [Patescibacteria group bacterium]
MSEALATYWKKYKAISPWVAMYAYAVTFVLWGIIFLDPHVDRAIIAAVVIPTGLILDYALHKLQTGKPNWQSALITSSIVTLLMPPDINLGIAFLAIALAIASKHFILVSKRHVFNPAGFGVAMTAAIFGYSLGWWPDSFLWLTLAFGLLNVWRVKKFPQIISFTVVYIVLLTLVAGFPSGSLTYSDLGTQTLPIALPVFFILFMLPEPMTSIQPKWKQIQFGALAAIGAVGFSYVSILAGAAVIWGLLVANIFARLRR